MYHIFATGMKLSENVCLSEYIAIAPNFGSRLVPSRVEIYSFQAAISSFTIEKVFETPYNCFTPMIVFNEDRHELELVGDSIAFNILDHYFINFTTYNTTSSTSFIDAYGIPSRYTVGRKYPRIVYHNKIGTILIGGSTKNGATYFTETLQLTKPSAWTDSDFMSLPPINSARRAFGVDVSGDKVYISGGKFQAGELATQSIEMLDVSGVSGSADTVAWVELSPLNTPHKVEFMTIQIHQNKMYGFGGQNPASQSSFSVYDIESGQTTVKEQRFENAHSWGSAVVKNGKIAVIGGKGSVSATLEISDDFDNFTVVDNSGFVDEANLKHRFHSFATFSLAEPLEETNEAFLRLMQNTMNKISLRRSGAANVYDYYREYEYDYHRGTEFGFEPKIGIFCSFD